MAATKIQDVAEVRRWYDAGHTYRWMAAEYARRYHLQIAPTAFSNVRARRGWPPRQVSDESLMPWAVQVEHRWDYEAAMLRMEARRRAGTVLGSHDQKRLATFAQRLATHDVVVTYAPATGFSLVPRRHGVDTDWIRLPEQVTRRAIRG